MTKRRVTVVASEILGVPGTGGPGTADSLLAIALGRRGHDVELLVAPGRDVSGLSTEWEATYRAANVRINPLRDDAVVVRPPFLAPTARVYDALKRDPPDVVVADDWRAVPYAALRARQLGLALAETAFVVYCHGPARVFAAAAQKVPDTVDRFGEEVAQRACVELADAVVSPSEWLIEWLREHRWPRAGSVRVIQNLLRSSALDEPVQRATSDSQIRRLAFFGQLREGKGINVFLESLRRLDPQLLERIDVLFLGHSRRWTEAELPDQLAGVARSVRVEMQLDQTAALEELKVPGTLAVMPSLLENSPYAVAECIEHGVPFLAANVGGTPELILAEDRARVLCSPTVDELAAALTRVLGSGTAPGPVRSAHEPEESLAAWLDLIETIEPSQQRATPDSARVTVIACGDECFRRAHTLARKTSAADVEVIRAASRRLGLERATADWVVFLDDEDVPDDRLLDVLVAAQAASGADVVTVAVRPADNLHVLQLFLGEAGALGLVENHYGVVGLIRRSVALRQPSLDGVVDPEWPLFARSALDGARIVSVPEAFAVHRGRPGTVRDVPGEGPAVLEAFEALDGRPLHDLAQLAATLAASPARAAPTALARRRGIARRGLGRVRRLIGRRSLN